MTNYDDYEYIKNIFEQKKNTDADYLIIGINPSLSWDIIPCENMWDTIDEAIQWHFENGWTEVEIYDLYAEFDKARIRSVSKATMVS